VRWDPVAQHDFTVKTYGYLGQSSNRTYYPYDNPDCEFYNGFQDYLKFIKLGYSKVTDQLVRDIRHGRITRNQALVVKKKYETNQPENINELAKWLNCTFEALNLSILNFARDFQEQIVNENWRARLSKFPTDENISQSSYTTDRLFLSRDERASEFGRGQWKNEIEC
jgi:hypothetical protein